jgi:hypothetical protein
VKSRIAVAAAIGILSLLTVHAVLAGGSGGDGQPGDAATSVADVYQPTQAPRPDCVHVAVATTGELAIDVPSFCINQPCQIMLWDDETVGAYGSGFRMAAYYIQSSSDDTWIGGPNLNLAGVSASDGVGTNGDSSADAIYAGGQSSDGNLVSLYDDSGAESSPSKWSITYDSILHEEEPTFYICPLAIDNQFERFDVSAAGTMTVTVPEFCVDGVCGILMWNDATIGAWGPGMRWPVHYTQKSSDGSWIGGPNVSVAGASFSDGAGVNGDASGRAILMGGQTVGGGYVRLYDDGGLETSPSQWTIDFAPDAYLTEAVYIVYPMACDQHPITVTGGTAISMPQACTEGVCTVLMWNDGTMGAFGPGIHLPVYYTQSPTDATWIGGPHIYLAGMGYNDGAGVNGDLSQEDVFEGGRTALDGYVRLRDDGVESSHTEWSAVFSPTSDLTEAAYWVCSGSCAEHDVPVPLVTNRIRLPLVQREDAP